MPCDTVRSTITEPSDTGHLESRRAKILAKKSGDSFARIAVLCSKHRFMGLFGILAQKTAISFARIDRTDFAKTLSAFPVVLEAEVLAVAVVEVAGLGVFGVWRHEV